MWLLTGGGSRRDEILDQLSQRHPGEVSRLDALQGLDHNELDAGAEQAPWTALLAIGAAEWAFDQPARRLSLLPKELAQAAAARRRLAAAAVVVVLAGAGLTSLALNRSHQASLVKAQAASVQTANTATQNRITQLNTLRTVLSAVQARLTLVTADQADNIAWPRLVQEITRAMPPGTRLTTLSLSNTPAAATGPVVGPSLGSINMAVVAHGSEDQVAVWLRAFAHLPGISSMWVGSATVNDSTVNFSATASITTGAPVVTRSSERATSS